MTTDQILAAIATYETRLGLRPGLRPMRYAGHGNNPTHAETLAHVYWMVLEMKTFAAEKPEKAQRWIGFIQGALWRDGGHTINQFKDDNRSEA